MEINVFPSFASSTIVVRISSKIIAGNKTRRPAFRNFLLTFRPYN